jgi:hypothetical protein
MSSRLGCITWIACLSLLGGETACGPSQPPWCTATGTPDSSCAGPRCVAAVVVDYKRLAPRGYRVFGVEGSPIDRPTAEARALDHVKNVERADPPDQSDCNATGDFFACTLLYNNSGDSWLLVLFGPTGQVLFSGLQVWADAEHRGYDFPLPAGFSDATALGCTDGVKDPESKMLVSTGSPTGSAPASTPIEAWSVAKRLNLTERFTAGRAFRIMVISYAPATGEFDPEAADWYVWINGI